MKFETFVPYNFANHAQVLPRSAYWYCLI